MESARRPRLSPAIADVRRAVRKLLPHDGLVLVGLSGGADSLSLAAACAFEARRAGVRAGAVIVDHGLQEDSADIAGNAARQAEALGLDPVLVIRVTVTHSGSSGGPEAAARTARYEAFQRALDETGANVILLGHTLDDQAETVLLGLARGSGPTSLHGMAVVAGPYRRPLLGIRRATTEQFCDDSGLLPWTDPHNVDPSFARVRVRERVLPLLETELGPGMAEALARTAEMLREDAAALDDEVPALVAALSEPVGDGIALSVAALELQPTALRHRIIRSLTRNHFAAALERSHTLAVDRLVTNWHGQKALDLPGVRVERQAGQLIFFAARTPPSKGQSHPHGTS